MCGSVDFEINLVNIYAAVSLVTASRYIKYRSYFKKRGLRYNLRQTSGILFA